MTVEELRDVALGWSAKRTVLGQPDYNEKDEKVGTIDDIFIAPDKAVSYAIVGAGGFLGLGTHDVAVLSLSWLTKNWFCPAPQRKA